MSGPRPDGQVRDVIEVPLRTSDRIGEAPALRKCDIDNSRRAEGLPMRVTATGTPVAIKGKGDFRQDFPKTSNSRRESHRVHRRGDPPTTEGHQRQWHGRRPPALLHPQPHSAVDEQRPPHTFRRTSGTLIAGATDATSAADALGNPEKIAQRYCIVPEDPTSHTAPPIHLTSPAPHTAATAPDTSEMT